MQQTETMITNFTSGEVSPKLAARVDIARKSNSADTLENFLIDPMGGAFKAPGTEFIAEVKTSAKLARLVSFIYSDEQAYVLEFGNLTLRFYKDQGQIYSSGTTPYEITTVYADTELAELTYCQSADVMYLFHPDHAPYKLSRLSHTSWTLAVVSILDGPYLPINSDPTCFLTPDGVSGNISLVATTGKSVFSVSQVGTLIRLRHSGASERVYFAVLNAVTSSFNMYGKFTVDLTPYQILESDSSGSIYTNAYNHPWEGRVVLQKSYDGSYWIDVASFFYATKQEFFESQLGVYYRCLCKEYSYGACFVTIAQEEHWGVAQISGVNSATVATAAVIRTLGSVQPTAEWAIGAWGGATGYPRCGVFGPDDRLWMAGSDNNPLTLWSSWVGDYENFMPGSGEADGALTLTINSRDASVIRWLMNYRGIAVGTSSGEGLITGADQNPGAITAKSPPTFTQHSTNGSAFEGVNPIRVGPSILFLHRHRRQVRELTYDIAADGFQAPNLNQLAEHVTESGIKEMAFVEYPIPQLWCVRHDGEVAVLTYLRREEVVGWTRIVTDGIVESICAIPSSLAGNEGEDEVWLLVARTIGGATKRYVELVKSNEAVTDIEDYWYLHSALSYDGTPTTTVSGLTHLAGETVDCLADGFWLHGKTVSAGGVVTLGGSYSRVICGLPYTSTLKVPVQVQYGGGTLEGVKKRITKLWLRLYKSLGGTIGPDTGTQDVIAFRTPSMALGSQVPVVTDDKQVSFAGGPAEKVEIMIKHSQPLPFNVLGIVSKVVVYDS